MVEVTRFELYKNAPKTALQCGCIPFVANSWQIRLYRLSPTQRGERFLTCNTICFKPVFILKRNHCGFGARAENPVKAACGEAVGYQQPLQDIDEFACVALTKT